MIQVEKHIISELPEISASHVFESVKAFLPQGPTLLLLSGGSVAKEMVPVLSRKLLEYPDKRLVKNLTIALVDERYGEPWHMESNMLALKQSDLTTVAESLGIELVFPLVEREELDAVVQRYRREMIPLFEFCQGRIVGVFGVGSDVHTAGIKPQRSKEEYESLFGGEQLVVGYEWSDFTRVTITPRAINQVNASVLYAHGDGKKQALETMLHGNREEEYKYPGVVFQGMENVVLYTDQELS